MAEPVVFVELTGGLLLRDQEADRASLASIRLVDGCLPALARFRQSGYAVVLLADGGPQSSAKSDANSGDDQTLAAFVTDMLTSQGIATAALEQCEHAADAGCDCALPGIGLVSRYVEGDTLNRARSIVVGRNETAPALARAIGVRGYALDSDMAWGDVAHEVLDAPRRASVRRTTRETDIEVEVDLDVAAEPKIQTGIGFFDHMLEQLGKHGGFALKIHCDGDLQIDEHHTVEDVALTLGQALRQALGDKRGIGRYGFLLPMDEAEARVAIDLSGRAFAVFEGTFSRETVGGLPTELVSHFFASLAESLGAAVHVSVQGENAHHMIEACFKGVARALRQAFAREGTDLPSTKGAL